MISRAGAFALLAALGLSTCGSSGGEPPVAEPPVAEPQTTEQVRPAASGLGLVRVGTFSEPVYVTAPPGDKRRLMVVEQGGRIRVLRDGRKLSRPFLDITDRVLSGGEQGLLSMAFAPDYRTSRRFYVYFTDSGGDIRVQEFKGRGDGASRGSARNVIRVEHSQNGNHNGGQLQFGPDKQLYMGTGDGGGAGDPFKAAQNKRHKLGKILRVNARGTGAGVYSYGLRNPWRFSFDRQTGDLIIGDVGQNEIEEIDFVRKGKGRGANFGWSVFEGTRRYSGGSAPGHVKPVIQHTHGDSFCSITGGYVLRARTYGSLRGTYVYSDYCRGEIRGARLSPGRARGKRRLGPTVSSPSSFGEDASGRVYVTSHDGPVYRLVPK